MMNRPAKWHAVVLAAVLISSPAWATMSGNLIGNGNFEDNSGVKLADSPRTQAELDAQAAPIRSWQFHPGGIAAPGEPGEGEYFTDFGKWIGAFGITTNDDPRQHWIDTGGDPPGVISTPIPHVGDPGAPQNVSYIDTNGDSTPDTQVMEAVRFRTGVGQYIQAPVGQASGQAYIDFDYYFNFWDAIDPGNTAQIMRVSVWGVTEANLPDWPDREFYKSDPGTEDILYDPVYLGPEWNSQQYARDVSNTMDYRDYISTQGDVWQTLSDGVTEVQHNPLDWTANSEMDGPDDQLYYDGTFSLDTMYPYYFVYVTMISYSEPHMYFWYLGSKPSDTMHAAVDNMAMEFSMQVPGDFTNNGITNLLDINDFVLAITNWSGYLGAYPFADLASIDPSQGAASGDPIINLLDIPYFVSIITGGGNVAELPEPATASLVILGALAMVRRRR